MKCDSCDEEIKDLPYSRLDVYDTPWDGTPREVNFCCEKCEESYLSPGDFNYYECEDCGRLVCYQNPRNGWHTQFRNHAEHGFVCLQCYEKHILEEGQPEEDFHDGQIKGGMFFDVGNPEPKTKGWIEEKTWFIGSSMKAKEYCAEAMELIAEGCRVLTAFEKLGIGGSEGTVTMMVKKGI